MITKKKAVKKVANKKVVKNKTVTKKVKFEIPKEEIINTPVTTDSFECAGNIDNVTKDYVNNIADDTYPSYQRRAEDFVEDNVTPVPEKPSKLRVTLIAIIVIVLFYFLTH